MMPRYAAKRDAVEREVVKALQTLGFSVERMDQPVDLLVGFGRGLWLVEVKTGNKGYGANLNPNQQKFVDTWRGPPVVIIRSVDEAIDWAARVKMEMAA